MALTTPNIRTSPMPPMGTTSNPGRLDRRRCAVGCRGWGSYVISGMRVAAHSLLTVAVALALTPSTGSSISYAGGTVAATSASASDRRDIVSINASGTLTVTAGTACGTAGWVRTTTALPPVKPAIPANNVLLAELAILSTTTTVRDQHCGQNHHWGGTGTLGAIMTATQTVNSTTPAAITALNMPLQASTNYRFQAELYGTNSASGSTGIAVAVVVPAGAVVQYDVFGSTNSTASKTSALLPQLR